MKLLNAPVLVTGAAGFIGSALVKKLIDSGETVVGLDNINDYYDKKLKYDRLENIKCSSKKNFNRFIFKKLSIEEKYSLEKIFMNYKPEVVVNLAAQAGVRYSIKNPYSYIQSNLIGFANVLEACRKVNVKNFIYASSSSVYGGNKNIPFSEESQLDHPLNIYAASKKSNELLAHSYSNIYEIPTTGLRLFTVYGPWGRPDMAPMIFTKSILEGKSIDIYNFGKMKRDFTYIDDIVESIFRCCFKPAIPDKEFNFYNPDSSKSFAPYRIFNVGNSNAIELLSFICTLEKKIGKSAKKNLKPIPKADVEVTFAECSKLEKWINFKPQTSLDIGIDSFIKWYKRYYLIDKL